MKFFKRSAERAMATIECVNSQFNRLSLFEISCNQSITSFVEDALNIKVSGSVEIVGFLCCFKRQCLYSFHAVGL